MFGAGKPYCGVVVEPAASVDVDVDNEADVEKFIDAIWPAIERMNARAPPAARVRRALVIVADAKRKPFAYTPKGAVRHTAVLSAYADEIAQAYERAEEREAAGIPVRVPTREEWIEEVEVEVRGGCGSTDCSTA